MNCNFIIEAVSIDGLTEFINLTDEELATKNAKWIKVDSNPGYPCRASLVDANVGERVLAFSFMHHDVNSPYRASGPIFIREKAETVTLKINEIPKMLKHRLLSLRAYNRDNFMINAQVLQGTELECAIDRQFQNREVEYIHIHNANPGCFNCSVHRAW